MNKRSNGKQPTLPLLNIARADFALKTELVAVLEEVTYRGWTSRMFLMYYGWCRRFLMGSDGFSVIGPG